MQVSDDAGQEHTHLWLVIAKKGGTLLQYGTIFRPESIGGHFVNR